MIHNVDEFKQHINIFKKIKADIAAGLVPGYEDIPVEDHDIAAVILYIEVVVSPAEPTLVDAIQAILYQGSDE